MKRSASLIALCLVPALVDTVSGRIIHVHHSSQNDFTTIQAAIDAAVDGDIVLIAPGTYTGAGNRDIDFRAKAVTVRSIDPNDADIVAATIVDCHGTPSEPHRGFFFHSNERAASVLAGLTITNGYGPQSHSGTKDVTSAGGAICCVDGSSPTIANCVLKYNAALAGGGIYLSHSTPLIRDCVCTANTANEGGALYGRPAGNVHIANCAFDGNAARGDGGALYVLYGDLTLDDCTFVANSAENRGGGIYVFLGTLVLEGCAFKVNTAESSGGTLYYEHTNLFAGRCVFLGNSATGAMGRGGAIANYASNTTLESCLFAGNAATVAGGGIWNLNGLSPSSVWPPFPTELKSLNCTFAENRAPRGNALASSGESLATEVTLDNSILRNGGDGIWNGEGSTVDVAYCSIEGGRPGTGNIDADPCFAAPGHWDPNGTPDDPNDDVWVNGDYHLKSQADRWDPNSPSWVVDDVTSPCIDTGDPNSPVAFEPFPNGGTINMGAYGGTAEASKSPSGLHAKYGSGTGEPNDPYLIYTAEHLNAIGTEPNDWDKHFRLMADVNLSPYEGDEFKIIGTGTQPFGGTFDGNGHKISHFTYRSSGKDDVGLFGCVYQRHPFDTRGLPVIKDVGLIDPNVKAGDGSFVGALIGCYGDGVITGCFVQGGSVCGRDVVGGLIGGFARFVEGLAPPISWTTSGQISDCYSRTRVSGTRWVGGLVGTHDHWISRCYSTGVVSGSEWVGGLTGCGRAEDSFWDVQASGQATSAGGTGLTTSAMQDPSTFLAAAWDFVGETDNGSEDIWWIDEGRDYPRLWWETGGEATP